MEGLREANDLPSQPHATTQGSPGVTRGLVGQEDFLFREPQLPALESMFHVLTHISIHTIHSALKNNLGPLSSCCKCLSLQSVRLRLQHRRECPLGTEPGVPAPTLTFLLSD